VKKTIIFWTTNYEVQHIWGGARCCEFHEQEHSWSPVIYHDFMWCHTVPLPCPSALCLQEHTMSTRYWIRQPHRPYHTSRHNSIHISASLQLNSYAYNILIYIYFFKTLSTATHYCDRMLTRCIFIEFPEGTVDTHGTCFLRNLRTQQEDEIQRNVSRDELYITHAITGSVFVGLLHFTLRGLRCCCTFIQETITRYKSAERTAMYCCPICDRRKCISVVQ
jgi:hypothetical protein